MVHATPTARCAKRLFEVAATSEPTSAPTAPPAAASPVATSPAGVVGGEGIGAPNTGTGPEGREYARMVVALLAALGMLGGIAAAAGLLREVRERR